MRQRSIRDRARPRRPVRTVEGLFEPGEPAHTIEPGKPQKPAQPKGPGTPDEPGTADVPGAPDEPGAAEGPGMPEEAAGSLWERLDLMNRLKRLPPGVVILTLAAILSTAFLVVQLVSRTASVQLLTSAALVCGMVYVVVAIACLVAVFRLRDEKRLGLSMLIAFIGGCAAFVASGAFFGALVLFLTLGF
jgi:hypothetical protein